VLGEGSSFVNTGKRVGVIIGKDKQKERLGGGISAGGCLGRGGETRDYL